MRAGSYFVLASLLLPCTLAFADTPDQGPARAQLELGYKLKQDGKCDQAIPYFEESNRLYRHPKALLNLADCETRAGKLLSAEAHTVDARDLAASMHLREFEAFAAKQLQALQPTIPKLLLKIAPGAPLDTVVQRDGVVLLTTSLSKELPVDPGHHSIAVRGGGYEHSYSVELAERESRTLELDPREGRSISPPKVEASRATPVSEEASNAGSNRHPAASTRSTNEAGVVHSAMPTQRKLALVTGGIGVASLGVSFALIRAAQSSWKEAALHCENGRCDNSQYVDDAARARQMGNAATTALAIGIGGLAAGGVLWLTAPSVNRTGVAVVPIVDTSRCGLLLQGSY